MSLLRLSFFSLVLALFCVSCDPKGPDTMAYDRSGLLRTYADEWILPAYSEWHTANTGLRNTWNDFEAAPDIGKLETLRNTFLEAWTAWQAVAPLDFGPAMEREILPYSNTFPCDTAEIAAVISSGSWNLEGIEQADLQGYPALDYLLFGRDASGTLSTYTTHPLAARRMAFTRTLVERLEAFSAATLSEWQNGYRDAFVAADGIDVGSSLSLLINALDRYLERDLRDGKVGIPLGLRSLGVIQPQRVEAYFSGQSVPLLDDGLNACLALVEGTDSYSLYAYLDAVDAQYFEAPLSDAIRDAAAGCRVSVSALSGPIDEIVVDEPEQAEAVYTALQQLIVLLKVDLPSALSILLTYQDNDGD